MILILGGTELVARMTMPLLIQIPENPNCTAVDGMVFQWSAARVVTHVRQDRGWCEITGWDDGAVPCEATACIVEDSGDGACYLVVCGEWGLRLRSADGTEWGESYLLLGGDRDDLRFAKGDWRMTIGTAWLLASTGKGVPEAPHRTGGNITGMTIRPASDRSQM
jgi:hypothetical protein